MACHSHSSPLNLRDAVAHSCNAYFCYVFRDMITNAKYGSVKEGVRVWNEYVYSFGFGVWSSMGTYAKDNLASSIEFNNPSSEPSGYWNMNSVSIDVSTLMGKYYVGFFINTDVTICVDTIFIK
jgi:cell division protein FtsI/penicillin-binding protein 2